MEFSLIEWAKTHRELPGQVDSKAISYPQNGAQNLARIESDHFWFTSRRRLILKILKQHLKPKAQGLDIGCGSGFNADFLSNSGFPSVGIDAYEIHRKPGRQTLGFIRGSIFSINPSAEFDFVSLLDVIEHIEDDQKFLEHVSRFIKPGGYILITVPAFSWLWSPIDEMAGHYRRYTKAQLRKLANSANLKIEKQYYFYGSTLPLYMMSRLMTRFKNSQKVSDSESLPSPIVNSTLKVILKLEEAGLALGGLPFGSSAFILLRKEL